MIDMLQLLAQTTKPAQPPAPGLESMLLPLLLMGAIVYFVMLRPQYVYARATSKDRSLKLREARALL